MDPEDTPVWTREVRRAALNKLAMSRRHTELFGHVADPSTSSAPAREALRAAEKELESKMSADTEAFTPKPKKPPKSKPKPAKRAKPAKPAHTSHGDSQLTSPSTTWTTGSSAHDEPSSSSSAPAATRRRRHAKRRRQDHRAPELDLVALDKTVEEQEMSEATDALERANVDHKEELKAHGYDAETLAVLGTKAPESALKTRAALQRAQEHVLRLAGEHGTSKPGRARKPHSKKHKKTVAAIAVFDSHQTRSTRPCASVSPSNRNR